MSNPSADIRFTANAGQAMREMDAFSARLASLANASTVHLGGIGKAVGGLKGHFAGLTGFVGAGFFAAAIKGQIDLMDASVEGAAAAGVNVQAYRELGYAAKFSGIEQEALTKTLARLSSMMTKAADGDPALKKLFGETLGINVRDASGALRSTDAVLADLAERFAGMEDGPRKTALAMEVFGERVGPKLVPFLNEGRSGIERLRGEFRQLHGVITDDDVNAAAAFSDNMDRIKAAASGVVNRITNSVVPALLDFSSFALKAAKDVGYLEAAWLSFGKAMAKISGVDEVGQLERNVKSAQAEVTHLQRLLSMSQQQMENFPKDPQIRKTIDGLINDVARANDKVKAAADALEAFEKAQRPVAAPKPPPDTTDDPKLTPTTTPTDTRMQAWEAGLARQRASFARHQQEIGGLRELSKQDEADYWKRILGSLRAGDAQRTAVELKHLDLTAEVRKKKFEGDQAARQVEIEEHRGQFAKQEALASEYVERARQKYGNESKEYQAALKFQQGLLRTHQDALRQISELRAQAVQAQRLDEVTDMEQDAQLRYQLGEITELRLLQVRGQAIEQRRNIELQAKQAEIEAMQGNPNADPVALEKLMLEMDAIRRRFKGLSADNKGQSDAATQKATMSPFESLFGVTEQAIDQGLQSMVTRGKITLGGLRDSARQIGGALLQELVTKPIAAWITGQARMVVMTWLFGKQKVAAEATTATTITAIQGAASLKTIAMKAYEAAAGAYAAIAGIPYVGPVLAPIAAGVALAGVFAFAKSIFSAEGGMDIGPGVNPIVQTHAREMILPAKHADTIRMLGDMAQSGGMGGGGSGVVEFKAIPMPNGFFMAHQDELLKVFQHARRSFKV